MKNRTSARILTAEQMKRGKKNSQAMSKDRLERVVLNWFIIGFVALLLALVCNDIEDTLAHHYEQSVFYNGFDSFWNPSYERIGPIEKEWPYLPRFTYDGWHLIKVIRQHLFFLWFAAIAMANQIASTGNTKWLKYYLIYAAIWHSAIWLVHFIFYDNLLLK